MKNDLIRVLYNSNAKHFVLKYKYNDAVVLISCLLKQLKSLNVNILRMSSQYIVFNQNQVIKTIYLTNRQSNRENVIELDQKKIALIVLASGLSTRFKGNKLLSNLNGKPLISYTFKQLESFNQEDVYVITRYDEIVTMALNCHYQVRKYQSDTQGESIVQGIRMLDDSYDGALILTGDQPLRKARSLLKMIELANVASLKQIIRVSDGLNYGNPSLFTQYYFSMLKELKNDYGGRSLFKKQQPLIIEVDTLELMDVDTKEDLKKIETIMKEEIFCIS
ncbi:MAG: nucleotidyltransferase family protein [Bacilli bacterium]